MNVTLHLPNQPRIHFEMDPAEFSLLQNNRDRTVTMFGASITMYDIKLAVRAPSGPTVGARQVITEGEIRATFAAHGEAEKLKFN